ncbi:MAG: restriction endonuclease subunit S, partial [Thermodesulfobacteriota bacterium]
MTDLITDHMDIWTGAQIQTANGGPGRGKNGYGQPIYGIKKLRELILELAVRGKLVPQDPDDEPASVLLDKIAEERKQLIKEGKIKKQKELLDIGEDEKPFELPDGWEWAKLGNFVYLEMGQSPPSKFYNQNNDGIPFFQGKADFNDLYPTPRYWCTQPNKYAYPGDVLLSVRAPVGPTNISDINCCIGRGLAALRPLAMVSTKFLLALMRAFQNKLEEKATGTTFVAVSKTDVESLSTPIPPLSEQNRIVAKVDELMALCDQLEQQQTDNNATHQTLVETLLTSLTAATDPKDFDESWQRIANHFDTLFTTEQSIDHLKQTILQLAVMGRLVPQDPDDEPASVLLEKIAKEKARLVKEGKIKRQKKLPEIGEDEKPFELPLGWKWVRFNQLVDPENLISYGVLVP